MSKLKETYEKFVKFMTDNKLPIAVVAKFEELLLVDGKTKVTVEPALELGSAIALTAEDGTVVPAPMGEYELEDGRIIVVEMDGIIAAINDAVVEAELDAEGKPKAKETPSDSAAKVKELIERVETVSKYNAELKAEFKKETDFLHKQIEAVTARLAESDNLVSEFMASVLDTPTKEPVVKVKNAFAKVEKNNPFLTRKK